MIHEVLLNIGLFMVTLVVFGGLPYIINQTMKEFNFFGLNRDPIVNVLFRSFAILSYLVIVFIFFFFNMKLLP